jgi:hypothetical protein
VERLTPSIREMVAETLPASRRNRRG